MCEFDYLLLLPSPFSCSDGKLGAVSEPCFFPHTLNMTFTVLKDINSFSAMAASDSLRLIPKNLKAQVVRFR